MKQIVFLIALLINIPFAHTEEISIHDRMFYYRSVDAVVWAMPLLNFNQYRKGHEAIGVQQNDIAYYSKIQDWRFQTATPNNTTPMINFFWNIEDGPVVIEMPPATENVKIFGTLMDAWQRPIDDVGALGRDQGKRGRDVVMKLSTLSLMK